MRKYLFVCACLVISFFANANEDGHFYADLTSQNVSVSSVINQLENYVDVADGSTFVAFRDTTDALGIRHQSYQQYYQSTKVKSHMVLVHSVNGYVRSINGSVMTNASAPSSVAPRINRLSAAKRAPKAVKESDVEHMIMELEGVFYNAYKVPCPETLETLYVDALTGEIIYRESALRNADVVGRGYTRYSGWQDMTVYENGGLYYLMDDGRNIATMNPGSKFPGKQYFTGDAYLSTLPADVLAGLEDPNTVNEYALEYIYSPMMAAFVYDSCTTLYSNSSELYTPRLTSVTISSAASSWWYDIWDTKPDLYIKVCDGNGNVLYTTSTKEDCSLPVTFALPYPIAVTEGYMIKLYDEDATSDSYGGSITLTSVTVGTKSWSGTNSSGSIVIEAAPIEYADIHWGMQKTIDFYQTVLGRNSFDGKGHIVLNIAFPENDGFMFSTMPNNAAAQSSFEPYYMFYGYGDGSIMNPVVSLDVMSHEFTHMVTGTNGNGGLDYVTEPGALNESFSDIMAMAVMDYAYGSCDWTIGSDVMVLKPNMRSLSNPKNSGGANGDSLSGAQPDTYMGACWSRIPVAVDTTQTVVHVNSGVQNYWFYLLSEGGSGTNDLNNTYSVTGIGIDKATQIAFRNLIFYLAPNATHEDARNGSIQAAIDLYGKDGAEHQAVANAWYAVGVGAAYEAPSDPITVKAKMPANWGNTITAWAWAEGSSGSWVTLSKEGDWYVYTSTNNPLNIVYVNGSTWNGDNNQSVDIKLTASTCLQLASNTSGKRTYSVVECAEEDESENYVVLAQRSSSTNWFYMTADLGTASNKRYQAVDAGSSQLSSVVTSGLEDKYYWQIEETRLHNAAGYSTWTSGNTANFDASGKQLSIVKGADGTYTFSFADGTDTRYLALNKTAGNNYFAYYKGTNQIYKLTLVKEGESGPATSIEGVSCNNISARKVLMDGQIYIIRDGQIYTIDGRRVR